MKKLLIVLAVLMLLLVGVLLYTASQANSIIASQKPRIERMLSENLGAQVDIGDIHVSAFPGVSASVSSFAVRPKGSIDSSDGQELHDLHLSLSLLPLLSRNLVINELSLSRPTIRLTKTADGIVIDGLKSGEQQHTRTQRAERDSTTHGETVAATENTETERSSASPINIDLKSIRVNDATIILRDEASGETQTVSSVNLATSVSLLSNELALRGFSLSLRALDVLPVSLRTAELRLNLEESALSTQRLDIAVDDGGVALVLPSFNLRSMAGSVRLLPERGISLTSLSKLSEAFPALAPLALQGRVFPAFEATKKAGNEYNSSGSVRFEAVQLTPGEMQVSNLGGTLRFDATHAARSFQSDDLTFWLGREELALALRGAMRGKKLEFENLLLRGFGGETSLAISTELERDPMPLNGAVEMKAINLQAVLRALDNPLSDQISGRLESMKVDFSGSLPRAVEENSPSPLQFLSANVALLLKDGTIKDYNLARDTLSSISDLPFLRSSLAKEVPEESKAALNKKDTAIESLDLKGNLQAGTFSISDMRLLSELFLLVGRGDVELERQSLNLQTTIKFSPSLSAGLAASVRELRGLLDGDGRLPVPLRIRGEVPNVRVTPDTNELLRGAGSARVREEAGRAIGRALGLDRQDEDKKEGASSSSRSRGLGRALGF